MKRIFPPKHIEREKGHGRVEIRAIQVSTILNDYLKFPYVTQVFRIDRKRIIMKTGKIEQEVAYGITSVTPEKASPEQLLELVRGHWSIENRLHYVRDFTFDEDRSQVRTKAGPRIMATLRNLTIGILRCNGFKNIAEGLRFAGRDQDRALALIGV